MAEVLPAPLRGVERNPRPERWLPTSPSERLRREAGSSEAMVRSMTPHATPSSRAIVHMRPHCWRRRKVRRTMASEARSRSETHANRGPKPGQRSRPSRIGSGVTPASSSLHLTEESSHTARGSSSPSRRPSRYEYQVCCSSYLHRHGAR